MPEFRIRQDNMTVAAASGEGEIMRYAYQYRMDGPLTIQVKHMLPSGPGWKLHMQMAQFPQPSIMGLNK